MSRVPHQASARLPGPRHPMFSSQTPAPLRLISQQTAFKSSFGFCWQIPRSGTTEFCQVPALHRKGVAEREGQAECSFTLPCPPKPPEPAAGESSSSGEKGAGSL